MKVSGRNRRSIILGGSVVAVIILWVFVLMPFFDRIGLREQEIEDNLKLIRKYTTALEDGQAGPGGPAGDILSRLGQIEAGLFKGQTVQLAAADIQKIVDGTARQSDLSIRTVRVMDSEAIDAFIAVPIQIIFESDLERLIQLITLIEGNRKLLTIPELQIRVKNRRKPREIMVTMKIAGYMKKEGTGS